MTPEQYAFGWVNVPEEAAAYGATLPAGDDFWDGLRAKDDNGDRYSYRAARLACEDAELTSWLVQDGTYTRLRSFNQGDVGSCVGNAEAKRAGYMAALDIFLRLDAEVFKGFGVPEAAYALSREEAGMLGRGDGSTGYGAAKAATKHGTLIQGVYGDTDVREYSVSRCREWGRRGLPAFLKEEAAQHKYGEYLQVDTAEKAWLCAGSGLVFNVCSGQGFQGDRDGDGAIRPRGRWMHSMCAGAARRTTAKGRKLILIDNSWGDSWAGGPYWLDQPAGSFYADLDVVGEMCGQGDTYVDLGYIGHARPELPVDFRGM